MKQRIACLLVTAAIGSGLLLPPAARAQCANCVVINESEATGNFTCNGENGNGLIISGWAICDNGFSFFYFNQDICTTPDYQCITNNTYCQPALT
jgi:hypothetical protein